ncbi:MAG: hypothetical protein PSN44_06420 [Gammaproteobacteria bacterium]|nr:hypothetical protein [Gammaproteobacteria bacterium]
MSIVIETHDLTLFGCPMHYIKAREFLRSMDIGEVVLFEVNKGDAVDEVLTSLRYDGQTCEIESEQESTVLIRVIKRI